jgi:hypothetical protein
MEASENDPLYELIDIFRKEKERLRNQSKVILKLVNELKINNDSLKEKQTEVTHRGETL